jgi:hypothetical protein
LKFGQGKSAGHIRALLFGGLALENIENSHLRPLS